MINETLRKKLNDYGSLKEPFFFLISYDGTESHVQKLSELDDDILFEINDKAASKSIDKHELLKHPLSFEAYEQKFKSLQEQIRAGNTYLLNLTAQTPIESKLCLKEIYHKAYARFKLKFKDQFVCFSPERFIQIKKSKIFTFPMKGTIDATLANAEAKILGDLKEMAEHTMVVDLLRNDLGIVSNKVRVDKFRYLDKINAGEKKLLQVSSKISGELDENWHEQIGDILTALLPAGSITGTPKKSTVQILKEVEGYDRGYYTGVFGVYDGQTLDSSVLIRYIQKDQNGKLVYKSGGGITCDSNVEHEYQELIDKIYLPF